MNALAIIGRAFLEPIDIISALVKAAVFGFLITVMGRHHCSPG